MILTSIEQNTISTGIVDRSSALAFALVLTTLVTGFAATPTDLVLVLETIHVVVVVVIFIVLVVRDDGSPSWVLYRMMKIVTVHPLILLRWRREEERGVPLLGQCIGKDSMTDQYRRSPDQSYFLLLFRVAHNLDAQRRLPFATLA